MKYGVNLPISTDAATPALVAAAARRAEELGFSSLWVGDHIIMPTEPEANYPYSDDGQMTWNVQTPWLDPILTLTWAAAATSSIRIGTAVLILAMRPAAYAAKQLATLDMLSGGRLTLGIGVGWLKEEFEILGQDFERRGGRMVEAIALMRACWSDEVVRFKGEFFDLPPFACQPKPAQGHDVPILIGGTSDLALKRVARIGNGWLPIGLDQTQLAERMRYLDERLAEQKRTRADLQITMQLDADGFDAEQGAAWQELGVTEIMTEISWRRQSPGAALDEMETVAKRLGLSGRTRI
jgi:probable F420-dependent oxidoreductase